MTEEQDAAKSYQLTITSEDRQQFKRLDQWLAARLEGISRTTIKNLFQAELIQAHQDIKLELKKMPPEGTEIEVQIPPPIDSSLTPENIPLQVLFEDEHLVIIVKPAGMVTHPAPGHSSGTLVHAILFHCPDLRGIGEVKRPGIVHRLDRGTSGVMVVAKTQQCHEALVNLFAAHHLKRQYQALTLGTPRFIEGKLESTIGRHPQNRKKMAVNVRGKKALTFYRVLESWGQVAHVEFTLETGRTHQIRVHSSSLLNCPVLMDELYGEPRRHLKHLSPKLQELLESYPYPFLHAKLLAFEHPITKQALHFEVPPPPLFQEVLDILSQEIP